MSENNKEIEINQENTKIIYVYLPRKYPPSKYKYQINVYGEVSYISCVKSHNVINLKVANGRPRKFNFDDTII